MIESFLEGTLYYDFPSFEVAVFSLLLAFVLSTILALTYQYTYRGSNFPNSFFQAMILSSVVTSMIMMAVGSNLAIGFGIIGAVAIIRFRTMISNPRNIIFMFAAISIGIATGVYGYAIALAGTLILCMITILLSVSPYRKIHEDEFDVLFLHIAADDPLDSLLEPYSLKYELVVQRRNLEGQFRTEYVVSLKKDVTSKDLFTELDKAENIIEVRVEKRQNNRL